MKETIRIWGALNLGSDAGSPQLHMPGMTGSSFLLTVSSQTVKKYIIQTCLCLTGHGIAVTDQNNLPMVGAVAASKVVCSGDALKSCTLGQDNQAAIDVQSAGPGQLLAVTF